MTLLHSFWHSPYEDKYTAEIQSKLAQDTFYTWNILGSIILAIQGFMLLSLCLRPGGPFHTGRRTGYVSLYLLLIVATVIFLVFHNRYRASSGAVRLKIGVFYAAVNCAWACGITALDQLGGNGLVVLSYVLMAISALVVLTAVQSFALFGSSFVILNVALLLMPDGHRNLFSNLVNSFVLCLLAVVVSCSLHRSRAAAHYGNIRLNELALTDQLTGLNNRRYLEVDVRHRLATLKASTTPVAGLMLDIDYFKQYNDKHGHQAGDGCLQFLAEVMKEFSVLGEIYATRYGGEEFFMCWVDCDVKTAMDSAERLRLAVEDRTALTGIPITVSAGVCIRQPWGDTSLEQFIYEADTALYRAKEGGRNRVVLYSEED